MREELYAILSLFAAALLIVCPAFDLIFFLDKITFVP